VSLSFIHLLVAGLRCCRAPLRGFILPPRANSICLNLPPILNEEDYQGRDGKPARQPGAYIHF